MANLDNDIEQILVDAKQLEEINRRLGEQITKDFADKNKEFMEESDAEIL